MDMDLTINISRPQRWHCQHIRRHAKHSVEQLQWNRYVLLYSNTEYNWHLVFVRAIRLPQDATVGVLWYNWITDGYYSLLDKVGSQQNVPSREFSNIPSKTAFFSRLFSTLFKCILIYKKCPQSIRFQNSRLFSQFYPMWGLFSQMERLWWSIFHHQKEFFLSIVQTWMKHFRFCLGQFYSNAGRIVLVVSSKAVLSP